MLGKDLYKIEVNAELSAERLKSLVFFYGPLIGNDALFLYEYLVLGGDQDDFEELGVLLQNLNISADDFEFYCIRLNEYRLLKTLRQENRYIFILKDPLETRKFIRDDILVRDFILKTSGAYYRKLTAGLYSENDHSGFEDVTQTLSMDTLQDWNMEDETYLQETKEKEYDFSTNFDVNVFLKDISLTLLPMRFRTRENMKELATLADLYSISYDKMRTFLPKVARTDSSEFDLNRLRYLCMSARSEYKKVSGDNYDVPCLNFLMNLQDGKEATEYDKKIIYKLSNSYHLTPPVINVLLEYGLRNCNNSLIENYLYPIASDLHRNDISTSAAAKQRLYTPYEKKKNTFRRSEEKLPVYDDSSNQTMSASQEEELLKLMGKK